MILPSLLFHSADETARFGALLGASAEPGNLIALYGDLGAGKTCLTQGIAFGLGIRSETITSPTYTLINEHRSGRIPLYHMDAYRIRDTSELGPIGFDEYSERGDGLLVIEWAGNIAGELPYDRIDIHLGQALENNARNAELSATGESAQLLLSHALNEFRKRLVVPALPL